MCHAVLLWLHPSCASFLTHPRTMQYTRQRSDNKEALKSVLSNKGSAQRQCLTIERKKKEKNKKVTRKYQCRSWHNASKGGGDAMTMHSFYFLSYLIDYLSFLSYLILPHFILLDHITFCLMFRSCGMMSQEHWFPSRVLGSIAFQDIPWASISFHEMSFLYIHLDTFH